MKNLMRSARMLAVILTALVPWAGGLRAENNTSVLITTNFNNGGTNYTVGNTGTSNLLTISDGGKLVNVASGVIGSANTANTNTVLVTGAGSMWTNGGSLTVGSSGSFNTLIISNGALVTTAAGGSLGAIAGSYSNSVRVTGSGSVWSNTTSGTITVGNGGGSNTLTIANGGVVVNSGGGLTVGNNAGNSSALVTDTGSVLQLAGAVNLSRHGNSLMVANGGTLFSSGTAVVGGTGYSNNTLVVAGPGSSWTNGGSVQVGAAGAGGVGNALYVTNGGRATFTTYALYGTNNLVYISGGGAVVTNLGGVAYIGAGTSSFNNKVRILDGATNYSGGTAAQVGAATGASSNVLEVAGTGSAFLMPGAAIQVGAVSGSLANGLVITNGGSARSLGGLIGAIAGASNNWALVSGQGSVWSNSSTLTVGVSANSFGNNLTIANSGAVVNTSATIGSAAGANSNSVLVTGSGSAWTNTSTLYVGDSGAFNQMTVTNGGTVISSGISAIGFTSGNSNSVLVSGSGSLWTNNGFVYIGRGGSFNSLTISNRGTVVNGESQITWSGGKSNVVTVTGSGSSWTNTGKITVGFDTTFGNQLMIADSGTVVSVGTSVIGGNASSRSNLVTVTGSGSRWTNNGVITVGSAGSFNQLIITNGGKVFSAGGVAANIGNSASAISNQVLVTGSGSLWNMNSYFGVGGGVSSAFNQLMIANSGTVVSAGTMSVGGGTNNVAVVTDPGSLASVVGLAVSSYGCQLIITNGGTVANTGTGATYIGGDGGVVGTTGNVVRVTGPCSTLSNNLGLLYIGGASGFNQLLISGGGMVVGTNAVVGSGAGATGNVATVTGPNSVWTNTSSITVGSAGLSNALFVSSGARVFASSLTAGSSAGSNRVEITSGGLVEANSLVAGTFGGNSISNDGGIYQFSTAAPTITPGVFGRISLNNGTISFRGVTNASVASSILANMRFSGTNTFRLDNASNTFAANQNYTFGYNSANPSNYAGLEMINGNTAWQSAWLAISNNGALLISNTSASILGVLTNSGAITVVNASATFASNVVLSTGGYTFAGATNTFASGLTIASGALFGGSGRVVNNDVTNAGTLAPGNSPGTMSFSSNLTLLGNSVLVLEIAGTNAANYDHLVVDGVLARSGTLTITNLGWTFAAGDTFDFFDLGVPWTGAFSTTNLPSLTGGLTWDFTHFDDLGSLSIAIPIPEPSASMALALAGLVAALVRGVRRSSPVTS